MVGPWRYPEPNEKSRGLVYEVWVSNEDSVGDGRGGVGEFPHGGGSTVAAGVKTSVYVTPVIGLARLCAAGICCLSGGLCEAGRG